MSASNIVPDKRLSAFLLIAAVCLTSLSACVLRPTWQKLASEGNLESRWIETGRFRHLVLRNEEVGSHLLILVGGDGGPWIRETRVSVDPTPNNPVLLRLMLDTAKPAVYLGRPCYFGTATDKGCEPGLWTFSRYGRVVVDSMCEAANSVSREHEAQTVQLIGYSGGGAIVLGMRACTDKLVAVSTIAGNLDPQAWAAHHGYSPLHDLSPLIAVASSNEFEEAHWQCRDDSNIPPSITDDYFAARDGAIRHIVETCTHATGWQRYWPTLIDIKELH